MSRKVDYFVKNEPSDDGTLNELCEVATRYVPLVIAAIEGRKARSFWLTPGDHMAAYNHLCAQQAALLMGAKEDIIQEIRDTRGPLNGTDPTDLVSFPVGTFPGFDLASIAIQLNTEGQNVAQLQAAAGVKLEEIRVLLEAQAESEGGQLEALLNIVGLLAV